MTDLQRKIFETIISLMKSNAGEYNISGRGQEQIAVASGIEILACRSQIELVKKILFDEGYAKARYPNSPWHLMLTPKGWEFTTFEDLQNLKAERISTDKLQWEKLQLEVDALRKQFFDYAETKKRVRRSEYIAVITVIIALAAFIVSIGK